MADIGTGVRLGIVLPPCPTPDELWATAARADDSALDSLWVTDRTMAGMPWLDGLTVLGALTAATRRVRLGTSVLILARRNPVHVAHALATVEHLAPGRLVVGVGAGNRAVSAPEFEIAGVDTARRGQVVDDHLSLLRRLWSEEAVELTDGPAGRVVAGLAPRPSRPLPIWIGGGSAAARRRAGRAGDGWMPVFSSPTRYPAEWAEVRAEAERAGRRAGDIVRAVYLFGAIDDDGTSARQLLGTAVPALLGAPFETVSDTCIWGTPEQWLARIAAWSAAGVHQVNVALFSSRPEHDVALVAEEVAVPLASSHPGRAA
jgi:alkanesulfonate monooxygenase SsuD/methylene tetrahydromethanopterin reductase-like flavin-dependent oxidoreductase (luciferase family)